MKYLLLTTAAILAFAATPAFANAHKAGEGKMLEKKFEKKDTNSDGALSKDEYDAYYDEKFGEMDADSDGSVSLDEAKAYKASYKEKWKNMREHFGKKHDHDQEGE